MTELRPLERGERTFSLPSRVAFFSFAQGGWKWQSNVHESKVKCSLNWLWTNVHALNLCISSYTVGVCEWVFLMSACHLSTAMATCNKNVLASCLCYHSTRPSGDLCTLAVSVFLVKWIIRLTFILSALFFYSSPCADFFFFSSVVSCFSQVIIVPFVASFTESPSSCIYNQCAPSLVPGSLCWQFTHQNRLTVDETLNTCMHILTLSVSRSWRRVDEADSWWRSMHILRLPKGATLIIWKYSIERHVFISSLLSSLSFCRKYPRYQVTGTSREGYSSIIVFYIYSFDKKLLMSPVTCA